MNMSYQIDIEEESTQALIGAIVRQAMTDYQNNYQHRRQPDAGEFLRAFGLLPDEEHEDLAGYATMPILRREEMPTDATKPRALRRAALGNGMPRSKARDTITLEMIS